MRCKTQPRILLDATQGWKLRVRVTSRCIGPTQGSATGASWAQTNGTTGFSVDIAALPMHRQILKKYYNLYKCLTCTKANLGLVAPASSTLAVATQQIPKKTDHHRTLEHLWSHSQVPTLTTLVAAHLHEVTNQAISTKGDREPEQGREGERERGSEGGTEGRREGRRDRGRRGRPRQQRGRPRRGRRQTRQTRRKRRGRRRRRRRQRRRGWQTGRGLRRGLRRGRQRARQTR
jgi:hypothetical protein